MRTLSLMLLALFVIAPAAKAQSFVEVETDGVTSAKLLLEKDWGEMDGVFVFGQLAKGWAQIYGGFYVKPVPWAKFSMGFGIERAEYKARFGTSFWAGNDRVSSFTLFEQGGSGWWYKHETTTPVWQVNAGVFSQRFVGTGPLVEAPLPYKFSVAGGAGFGQGGVSSLVMLRRVIH